VLSGGQVRERLRRSSSGVVEGGGMKGRGGRRRRGSLIVKASREPRGRKEGLVSPCSWGHMPSGESGEPGVVGLRMERSAAVADGPVISILPISNRRSSMNVL
jgi:hypothetical protein